MSGPKSATVETLTAEVRVLMVGNRQVTLSVYRQLDVVRPDQIDPFGRVCDSKDEGDGIYVIGCERGSGALVRAHTGQRYGARTTPPDRWCVNADVKDRWGAEIPAWRAAVGVADDGSGDEIVWKTGKRYSSTEIARGPDVEIREDLREHCAEIVRADLAANAQERAYYAEWSALPLIVLAGLR